MTITINECPFCMNPIIIRYSCSGKILSFILILIIEILIRSFQIINLHNFFRHNNLLFVEVVLYMFCCHSKAYESGFCLLKTLPPRYNNMDRIAVFLPQLLPNRLKNADHVTNLSIFISHAHIHNAPIIRNAVKSRMYFHSAFSKLLADVPGKDYVCSATVRIFYYYGIKFILFHSFFKHRSADYQFIFGVYGVR